MMSRLYSRSVVSHDELVQYQREGLVNDPPVGASECPQLVHVGEALAISFYPVDLRSPHKGSFRGCTAAGASDFLSSCYL